MVIKKERTFLFWLLGTILIAPLGSWIIFINNSWDAALESFSNILTLTLALSLIIPIILDLIIDIIVTSRKGKEPKFLVHKGCMIIISLLLTVLLFIFLSENRANSYSFNFAVAMGSIFFSFYLYCLSKVTLYKDLELYDAQPYESKEKERLDKINEDANKAESDGDIKL